MLLGKRPRPPMKRTTSMTEFTLDLTIGSDPNPLQSSDQKLHSPPVVPSPRHRRNSADFVETANFLRSCHLCKRRLIPGRDIFMYRGDSAFCSSECRQQQIYQDERKEKRSMKEAAAAMAAAMAAAAGSETVGESVAAAV